MTKWIVERTDVDGGAVTVMDEYEFDNESEARDKYLMAYKDHGQIIALVKVDDSSRTVVDYRA